MRDTFKSSKYQRDRRRIKKTVAEYRTGLNVKKIKKITEAPSEILES